VVDPSCLSVRAARVILLTLDQIFPSSVDDRFGLLDSSDNGLLEVCDSGGPDFSDSFP